LEKKHRRTFSSLGRLSHSFYFSVMPFEQDKPYSATQLSDYLVGMVMKGVGLPQGYSSWQAIFATFRIEEP
ncbi:hypothetical protein, partial [Enterococcus faecalis]|uniref:hypothetical protein n=1 Tax=Enterococcus faecalis TaxID=1351 RepID=UPI003CC517A6